MEIAFLVTLNPNDIRDWSGTTFHLYQTLQKRHNVHIIGVGILEKSVQYIRSNFSTPRRIDFYSRVLSALCNEEIDRLQNLDLVFFGDIYLNAFLDIKCPSIVYTDSLFIINNAKKNSEDKDFVKSLVSLEQGFFQQCDTAVFASEWIKNEASQRYAVHYDKVRVLEFGANIPHPMQYQIDMPNDICQITFIGRHWKAKGGDIAFKTYKLLQERGVPSRITFIGCTPPKEIYKDEGTTIFPFLDKSKPDELQQFCDILYNSHFLLLPTRFDAFGIAFAEASAYGVPSLGTRVGGTAQAVREGKNGYLLPLESGAEEYADKIIELWSDSERYRALRQSSRREYETRLNWDVWLERIDKIFEETIVEYHKKNDNGAI